MSNHRHFSSNEKRLWRKIRIREKIEGTAEKPRLAVYKSNRFLYVQAIDDLNGKTLAAASSLEGEFQKTKAADRKNLKIAGRIGELISERLKEKGVSTVVFDRSGYNYHGKVKAVAESVRKSGLLK